VSCAYWTSAHEAVFADCRTSWVTDPTEKQQVWERTAAEAARFGQDSYAVWPGGAADPTFCVLRLDPWRVQITLPDLEQGRTINSSRVWHARRPELAAVAP